MPMLPLLALASAACLLAGCARHGSASVPPAAAASRDTPQVVLAQPGAVVSTPDTTIVVPPAAPPPVVVPSVPPGTVELSGFKPTQENLASITRIAADTIEQDAAGKYTLRGNAVVEITQGASSSRLTGEQITIQGGPGFNPVIERRTGK